MIITITVSESNGYDATYSTKPDEYKVNEKQIEMLFEIMRAERLGRGETELSVDAYAKLLGGVLALGLNMVVGDYSKKAARKYRYKVMLAAEGHVERDTHWRGSTNE